MSHSNNPCTRRNCNGRILTVQSGGFINGTRIVRYRCEVCQQSYASIQLFIPTEEIAYRQVNGRKRVRFRDPMTIDLDPDLEPEIHVHRTNDSKPRLGE